jgi:hypothetical protein
LPVAHPLSAAGSVDVARLAGDTWIRPHTDRPRGSSTACSTRPGYDPRSGTPGTATSRRGAGLRRRGPRGHAGAPPERHHQPGSRPFRAARPSCTRPARAGGGHAQPARPGRPRHPGRAAGVGRRRAGASAG